MDHKLTDLASDLNEGLRESCAAAILLVFVDYVVLNILNGM